MSEPAVPVVGGGLLRACDLDPHGPHAGRLVYGDRIPPLAVQIEIGRVGAIVDDGHVEPAVLDRLAGRNKKLTSQTE